jgi:uncharacterized protein YfcZ (UPF0381/DUF406 family)
MTIDIDKLRAAHAATTEKKPRAFRELSNEDLRDQVLPVVVYEVDLHYNAQRDRPYKATISEIKITRFGISPGCSGESIDFVSRGQKCRGSADLFYPTREDAQSYADSVLEEARATTAQEDFQSLAHNEFPAMLDEIERLRAANEGAYALLCEFADTINNSLEGDHPNKDEVLQWITQHEDDRDA